MYAVLDDLVVGAGHEADADWRVVGWANDDLPLAFGEDGPVERLAPEAGQSKEIVGIDDNVVEGYGHSSILLHRARPASEPAVQDAAGAGVRRRHRALPPCLSAPW